MPKRKQKSFEESLSRLDEIIDEIESGSSLEDSVKLYKEGVELSVMLNETLNAYEKEVAELIRTPDGGFIEKPFDRTDS